MNYPTTFPELSSERLTLRQLSFKDKRDIFKLRANKEVNKLITRETPKNLNDADAFIQTCLDEFEKGNRIFWAIEQKETYQMIGTHVASQKRTQRLMSSYLRVRCAVMVLPPVSCKIFQSKVPNVV